MTTLPENPPAFPVSEVRIDGIGICEGSPGMTLRDWFAGQAVAGLVSNSNAMARASWLSDTDARKEIAAKALALADAMLAERARASQ